MALLRVVFGSNKIEIMPILIFVLVLHINFAVAAFLAGSNVQNVLNLFLAKQLVQEVPPEMIQNGPNR